MQDSGSSVPLPEAILEWLDKEMGYRSSSNKSLPSIESLQKICRGNMVPVWNFLVQRVKSEKTVEKVRRNIVVHGRSGGVDEPGKGRVGFEEDGEGDEGAEGGEDSREAAMREREAAREEVERLRRLVQRQRRKLKERMIEVSRDEAERKRTLDDRFKKRHKQVMLEAYDQQCEDAAKIFAEYQRRLQRYVDDARDARRSAGGVDVVENIDMRNEKRIVLSENMKDNRSSDNVLPVEITQEKNIWRACETLTAHTMERIKRAFPAYEGTGIHLNPQLEAAKLSIELDGEVPEDIKSIATNALNNPPLVLQALTMYTMQLKSLLSKEVEKIDVQADAELLRYRYEDNKVMDVDSPDVSSPLQYPVYGSGKIGFDIFTKGTHNQILERQKAHVQQFVATEDALNKAAEAKNISQKLIKRLQGISDTVSSQTILPGGTSQNVGSLRHFELDVWAKEREAAGLRASLTTLTSEVQRLNKLCAEWKEAEDSLRKKWKKIEEFDARRSELESIYTALFQANMDASAFWEQQPLAAREYASGTIIPACTVVAEISTRAKDLIKKEISEFNHCPDNSLYMLPSTSQGLLEALGANGSTGPEAVAAAEKNAASLTTRAGAGDPSAIPSICRVSSALQYRADTGLPSVLESLEFCLKLRGSEASVLEDLSKAINMVNTQRDLVDSGHALLNHAYHAQQEYERTADNCLTLAKEQENVVSQILLPELKNAILDAQNCLEDCKRVRGLVDEWWEQPAATVVDWVTIDGQSIAAWLNHVKQLQMAYYDRELL